jgi:hypothetical protein
MAIKHIYIYIFIKYRHELKSLSECKFQVSEMFKKILKLVTLLLEMETFSFKLLPV